MKQKILNHFQESTSIKKILEKNIYSSISKMGKIVAKKLKGGKIFFVVIWIRCWCTTFSSRIIIRLNLLQVLPAIALSLDISTLTACSNDYGFDKIYERSLES